MVHADMILPEQTTGARKFHPSAGPRRDGYQIYPLDLRAGGRALHVPVRAGSQADVQRLNDDAAIPYDRVVEALDLTP